MCSEVPSGTEAYMSLYPEKSTDAGLRLGNVVPDFAAETTHGPIKSFVGLLGRRSSEAGPAARVEEGQVGNSVLTPG